MRKAAFILAALALAGRAPAAGKIQVSMPNEAVGFKGTLLAQLAKPIDKACFTIRVVRVVSFAADNKTTLDAAALSAVWNGKYVWCGPAADAAPCPPLQVGDLVTVTGYQNEMHIRYSALVRPEKPKPTESASQPKPPDSPAPFTARRDVEYARVGAKALLLDLYTPTAPAEKTPLVVWIHGGAWRSGSKANPPPQLLALTAQGYAVASINYRLSQEAIFPAQIEDCKAAVRFLRANAPDYGLDGDRIGACGNSAGGHLAALLGTSGDAKALEGAVGDKLTVSSRVQCVVDFFGPTDMLQFQDKPTWVKIDSKDSPLVQLMGGPLLQKKDLVAKANPIAYVSKDSPPFLIAHGDKDNTVPIHQSELLAAALAKADVEVTFEVVKGAGHGFSPAQSDRLAPVVKVFLDKHLKSAGETSGGDK